MGNIPYFEAAGPHTATSSSRTPALWGPWQRRHCLPHLHWPDLACGRHTWPDLACGSHSASGTNLLPRLVHGVEEQDEVAQDPPGRPCTRSAPKSLLSAGLISAALMYRQPKTASCLSSSQSGKLTAQKPFCLKLARNGHWTLSAAQCGLYRIGLHRDMPRRVRIRMACIAIVVIVMASLAANEYVLVHVATLSKSMARLFNPVAVDEGVDEGHVPRSA